MLAAAGRLRRREEFAATIRSGRRASRGGLVVHFALPLPVMRAASAGTAEELTQARQTAENVDRKPASADEQSARAGFVVSKAVGNAVVRNKVKRRLRHLVRARIGALPAGSSLVVRALPEAASREYQILEKDLEAALAAAQRPRSPRSEGVRR